VLVGSGSNGGNPMRHLKSSSACMLLHICQFMALRSTDDCVDGACRVNCRVREWDGELVGSGCVGVVDMLVPSSLLGPPLGPSPPGASPSS